MIQYTFSIEQANQHYVRISAEFEVSNDVTEVQLPAWRPGRYELGNFAKNVRNFKVYDNTGKLRTANKIVKDRWSVDTKNTPSIKVEYLYFANELNAGSTFLEKDHLYVNPVNCCVYTDEQFNDKVTVKLMIPDSWTVAGSLQREGDLYTVSNVEEWMDTPFIASPSMQHQSYISGDTTFHVWFNGEAKPDWERLLNDYKAFTDAQIKKFTEFPVKEYHFLNQILPYKTYHGVEHLRSTVIALGPSYNVFGDLYKELLGVSSHELYHAWNVKTIRPIEMYPYDYTKENYSRLGYICEGVTTYHGDLFLLKSGVFDDQQYFNEFDNQLQKHFDSEGRFNYSVAESSFDTWLDGYTAGVPGRKVSIYTEGCLLAFVTDIQIRKATNNKFGLDDVMKRLYFNYALKQKGVSAADYQNEIEALAGTSFKELFDNYFYDHQPFEGIVTEALDYIGLEIKRTPSESYAEARLGMKVVPSGKKFKVVALYSGGPADMAGLSIGDEILAVNEYLVKGELDKWLRYFDDEDKELTVGRGGRMIKFTLPEVDRDFYLKYRLQKVQNPNNHQKAAFESWKKG